LNFLAQTAKITLRFFDRPSAISYGAQGGHHPSGHYCLAGHVCVRRHVCITE